MKANKLPLAFTSKCLGIWLLVMLISTCSHQVTPDLNRPAPLDTNPLQSWKAVGKASIRTGEKAQNIHFDWQQNLDKFKLQIRGAWGIGLITLVGGPETVTLRNKEGLFQAQNLEALLQEIGSIDLPAGYLRYWILGQPAPQEPAEDMDYGQQGVLQSFMQAQWHLNYLSFQQVQGIWLPKKIELNRAGMAMTLLVRKWHI